MHSIIVSLMQILYLYNTYTATYSYCCIDYSIIIIVFISNDSFVFSYHFYHKAHEVCFEKWLQLFCDKAKPCLLLQPIMLIAWQPGHVA